MKSTPSLSTGECFEPGQVWMGPRGGLCRVMSYAHPPGRRKQAILRGGSDGRGRRQLRDWDAVNCWVIHTHRDGTPASASTTQA